MYNYSSNMSLANVSFSGNSASNGAGGGMFNVYSSQTLVNVSFSANIATYGGGGMYNNSSSPTLVNNIVWGNCGGAISGGAATVSYSIVQGGYDGTGNLDADPLFVDADGADNVSGTADDDLRLQPGSPAINTGSIVALPADTYDLDTDGNTTEPLSLDLSGNPRVSGASVDMGAYEYILPASISAIAGTPQTALLGHLFAPLQARVTDSLGNPLKGVPITFSAPASGATGSFSGGGTNDTVPTGSDGSATAPDFTANAVIGDYEIVATVDGTPLQTSFQLANVSTATQLSLSATPNPALVGQEVTLQATVSSSSGTPAGSVTF
jgi:hypothetical protein